MSHRERRSGLTAIVALPPDLSCSCPVRIFGSILDFTAFLFDEYSRQPEIVKLDHRLIHQISPSCIKFPDYESFSYICGRYTLISISVLMTFRYPA